MKSLSIAGYKDERNNQAQLQELAKSAFLKALTLYCQFVHKSARIGKISILKLEGIIKKISYEPRDYESVDEKSLS